MDARTPQEICAAHGSPFVPPAPLDKVAVALNTLDQSPLNARRISPERGTSGWYVWGGEGGRSRTPGFFQTLQFTQLFERCPQLIPFLALAPGWRVRLDTGGVEVKAPDQATPPDNVAARRIGARTARTPPVKQWVWLSILLHILAIALFGDTTGAGSRRGERLGGPLNVILQGRAERTADAMLLRRESRLSSLEPGSREPIPAAVTQDTRKAAPSPVEDRQPVRASVAPGAPADAAATPIMPPVMATEVKEPATHFVVPVTTPEPVATPEPPAARIPASLPRLDAIAAPRVTEAPMAERDIALPSELIPRLSPLAPAARATIAPVEATPRAKTFVPPTIEAEPVAPPLELPRMSPLSPPQIERELARPADLLPRLPPVTPVAPLETAKPTDVVPRVVQPVVAAPAAIADPSKDAASAPASPPPVSADASVSPTAARVAPGTPAATDPAGESRLPRSSAPAPVAPGSTPRIDLDAVRQRARELSREGGGPRTLLPFNVRPKEDTRTKEQQAFDKALKRPDCRDAYADMGLAAVVPLILDTVREKGCKW